MPPGGSFGRDGTFLVISTDGVQLAGRIQLAAQADLAKCFEANSTRGELTMQLVMDGTSRVVLRISGALSQQPVGLCVATAFEHAIAQVPVPTGVRVEDSERTLTLPLSR